MFYLYLCIYEFCVCVYNKALYKLIRRTLDENLPAKNFLETLGQYMKGQIEIENREMVSTE